MIYLALATITGSVLVVVTLLGVLRSVYRQHARERQLLIDQILHLAGKPWHEAPAEVKPEPEQKQPRRWTASPEQQPIFD